MTINQIITYNMVPGKFQRILPSYIRFAAIPEHNIRAAAADIHTNTAFTQSAPLFLITVSCQSYAFSNHMFPIKAASDSLIFSRAGQCVQQTDDIFPDFTITYPFCFRKSLGIRITPGQFRDPRSCSLSQTLRTQLI